MKVNSEAIYDTTASPFKRLPWGRCTKKVTSKGATLYLHVFDWPKDSKLVVPGLRNTVQKAYLLADKNEAIAVQNGPEGVTLALPSTALDSVSSTIVLKVKGRLEIEEQTLRQQANGAVILPASEATVHGSQLRYESGPQRDNLGFWLNPADSAEWHFTISKPGRFEVSAELAAPESARIEVQVNGQTFKGEAPVTGDYGKFRSSTLGTVNIPATGKATLSVKGIPEQWHPLNLKSIRLVPAE